MARHVLLAAALSGPCAAAPLPWSWNWSRIGTWCFPTFSSLPLTQEQLDHYVKFDMIDICAPGLVQHKNGTYEGNVVETSIAMMDQIVKARPDAKIAPYIGFELGQSWYKAMQVFNTDPWCKPLWLKYKNGTAATCDEHNHALCSLLQRQQPDAKVYDWRAPGMIEYFLKNLTGPLIEAKNSIGIFYDDIYTLCDYVTGGEFRGDFEEGAAKSFCAATFEALAATADQAKKLGKVAILSVKGDESNATPFNMTTYEELAVAHDAMAYFEYWGLWIGQPRNEDQLEYAIRWGQRGVPMQMHGVMACKTLDPTFPLAMYLVAASEYSYFSTGYGWNPGPEQSLWLPEYERKLGKPKGPATKTGPHVWEREFEGLHVHLDMADCNDTRLAWRGAAEPASAVIVA